jgi:Zn-finger nucleic acid-binding protein
MNCPKCQQHAMDPESLHGVSYERCPHCQGMFYEGPVLEKVIAEGIGSRDSLAFSVQSDLMDPITAHCFRCARDMTPVMMQGVRIDRCDKCQGVFLDQGEVASLQFAR